MLLKNPKNFLYLVKSLLAVISKSDLRLLREIKHAIKLSDNPRIAPATTILRYILGLYSDNNTSIVFYHWNMLDNKQLYALWLYSFYLKILEIFRPYKLALIIVTNNQSAQLHLRPTHPHAMNSTTRHGLRLIPC